MIGKMIDSRLLIISMLLLAGCDDGRELARMQAEVNRAASELVVRDAQARQEMMEMQTAIDKERRKVSSLEEAYRKRVAKERTDPVIAEAMLQIACIFMCLLPLIIAIKLLSGEHAVPIDPIVDGYLLDEQITRESPDASEDKMSPKCISYRDLNSLVEDRLAQGDE